MDSGYDVDDVRHFLDVPDNSLGDDGSDFSDVDERFSARHECSDTEESLDDEPPDLPEPYEDDEGTLIGHLDSEESTERNMPSEPTGNGQGIHLRSGKRSQQELSDSIYLGMDQITKWSTTPVESEHQTKRIKLENTSPSPSDTALNYKSELECWSLFFPDSMLEKLVFYTNVKIRKVQRFFKRPRDAKETNLAEIKALIGLIYLSAVTGSNRRGILDLWRSDGLGVEIFRLSLGSNRFRFLLQNLRFDDVSYLDRQEWNAQDKLHRFREFLEDFVQNCQQNYHHGDQVTVDKMLIPYRGKCSFRVYHPKKPGKYGIKIWALSDTQSHYTSNLEIHLPNQAKGPFYLDTSPKEVVKRLASWIVNTGRNITCDKVFTSVPLARDLLKNHLTLVGTIKRNNKEIPLELVTEAKEKERPLKSSLFAHNSDCTLVSYKPGRKKIILLLSSLHKTDDIDPDSGSENKPSILTFYDKTKSAVTNVDAMFRESNAARLSNRWPLTLFYVLLNVGGLNAFIIHSAKIQQKTQSTSSLRASFMENLGKQLLVENARSRISLSYPIAQSSKDRIIDIFKFEAPTRPPPVPVPPPSAEDGSTRKAWRCGYCTKKQNRKTSVQCKICFVPICGAHKAKPSCFKCEPDEEVKPPVGDVQDTS